MPASVKGPSELEYNLVGGMEILALWQSVRYENVPLYKLKPVTSKRGQSKEKTVEKSGYLSSGYRLTGICPVHQVWAPMSGR